MLYGAPIGVLGGLIGLGGAEFRLPVLAGVFGYRASGAVALNLAISLPTVAVGVLRHRRLGAFAERRDLTETVAPMGAGSVIGAVAGGLMVGMVPAAALKLVLGTVLIFSAARIFLDR